MKDHRSIRNQNLHKILLSKFLPSEELNRIFDTKDILNSFDKNSFLEVYESLEGREDLPEIKFNVPFMEFGRFCVLFR